MPERPISADERWQEGDEIHLPRIDFTGRVESIGPTADPVLVLRAEGGAKLTMSGSQVAREIEGRGP